jgi:hypothetical protein
MAATLQQAGAYVCQDLLLLEKDTKLILILEDYVKYAFMEEMRPPVDALVDQWIKQFLLVWAMSMPQMDDFVRFVYMVETRILEDVWENLDFDQFDEP